MPIAAPLGAGNVVTGSAGSVNNITLAKPSNTADGDVLVAFVSFRNSGGTITAPSGWTALGPLNTTNQTFGAFYKAVPTASAESATSYAFSTSAGSSRVAGAVFRLTGADLSSLSPVGGSLAVYTGTASVVLPGISPTKASALLAFAMNNNGTTGTPSVVTAPSGMTTVAQASGDNGTSATMSIGVGFQAVNAGATGDKTATFSPTSSNSGGFLAALAAIPAANVPPTASAGAAKTGAVGTATQFTGTDSDSDGTIASRAWSVVSNTGGTAPTLANANTATVTVTPQATGLITLRYTVTDNSGATTTSDTKLFVPALTVSVIGVTNNTGGYATVGSAASLSAALSDADDTTYAQSPTTGNAAALRVRLAPLSVPGSTFSMTLRSRQATAGTATATVTLYEGSTARKQWTVTLGTSFADVNLSMTAQEVSSVTSWNELDVEFAWTA